MLIFEVVINMLTYGLNADYIWNIYQIAGIQIFNLVPERWLRTKKHCNGGPNSGVWALIPPALKSYNGIKYCCLIPESSIFLTLCGTKVNIFDRRNMRLLYSSMFNESIYISVRTPYGCLFILLNGNRSQKETQKKKDPKKIPKDSTTQNSFTQMLHPPLLTWGSRQPIRTRTAKKKTICNGTLLSPYVKVCSIN